MRPQTIDLPSYLHQYEKSMRILAEGWLRYIFKDPLIPYMGPRYRGARSEFPIENIAGSLCRFRLESVNADGAAPIETVGRITPTAGRHHYQFW